MQEQISLKLCLLTSITEKSGEEVENEVLPANSKKNCILCQIRSEDKQNSISAIASPKSDSEEV